MRQARDWNTNRKRKKKTHQGASQVHKKTLMLFLDHAGNHKTRFKCSRLQQNQRCHVKKRKDTTATPSLSAEQVAVGQGRHSCRGLLPASSSSHAAKLYSWIAAHSNKVASVQLPVGARKEPLLKKPSEELWRRRLAVVLPSLWWWGSPCLSRLAAGDWRRTGRRRSESKVRLYTEGQQW